MHDDEKTAALLQVHVVAPLCHGYDSPFRRQAFGGAERAGRGAPGASDAANEGFWQAKHPCPSGGWEGESATLLAQRLGAERAAVDS